jgi:flagellar motility protein MotE (MotC chaperone)
MKPAVKYAIMGGGALVLLFGSFVTFAALSGQPLSKVAILRNFVGGAGADETKKLEPETAKAEAEAAPPASREPAHAPAGTELKAVEHTASVLSVFSLPSPFSSDELTDLQHELRSASQGAKSRLSKIEQRERELDDRERDLDQRQQELSELRQKLAEKESELRMLSDEATRDSAARSARDAASWKELSKFFEEGDPADLAKKLLSFDPREAARILRSLDDERASAIVNALPAEHYHDYLEAYRAQTAKDGGTKKP